MAADWYIKTSTKEVGPLTSQQLLQIARAGRLTPSSYVRQGENTNWVLAEKVKGLFGGPSTSTNPHANAPQHAVAPPKRTQPTVASSSTNAKANKDASPEYASKQANTSRTATATFLLLIGAISFAWYCWIGDDFFQQSEAPIRVTFLLLGLLNTCVGIFFLVGGELARNSFESLGLDVAPFPHANSPIRSRFIRRLLTRLLQASALWHFTWGWLFVGMIDSFRTITAVVDSSGVAHFGYSGFGTPAMRAAIGLCWFGLIPMFLSPFTSRDKKWALIATFVVFFTYSALRILQVMATDDRPDTVRLLLSGWGLYLYFSAFVAFCSLFLFLETIRNPKQ